MIIKLGQVSMSIQAIVTEIYYISNHWNSISNHWTLLYIKSTRVFIFTGCRCDNDKVLIFYHAANHFIVLGVHETKQLVWASGSDHRQADCRYDEVSCSSHFVHAWIYHAYNGPEFTLRTGSRQMEMWHRRWTHGILRPPRYGIALWVILILP